jgi:predicted MPP superfamily phosphohydrolase
MIRRLLPYAVLLGLTLLGYMYALATKDPVVRRAEIGLANWPAGAAPIRAVLISDVHVAGPDMPPARLAAIVAQINALRPDLVLIAGDLISEKRVATRYYSMADAIRPLGELTPRLGTVAVLGNHDHWYDAPGAVAALRSARVVLLDNQAVQLGPIAIGGLDDAHTRKDDVPATIEQLRRQGGAKLILSHSPDVFPELPADIGLTLAGHTHCGQIAPPLLGPIVTASRYGRRFACGLIREGGRSLIVTAGLGTSGLPLRLGAEPDLWLLTLRSAAAR